MGAAYKNFFESLQGKRKGIKVKPPRFKKKDNRQTARFRKGGFSIKREKVYLAKIDYIKTKWSRPLPSEPSSITVIKDRSGRYFLSFVVEIQPNYIPFFNQSIGIDLGLKIFAALSSGDGANVKNSPTFFTPYRSGITPTPNDEGGAIFQGNIREKIVERDYSKLERRIRRSQRCLSCCKKGSKRRDLMRLRIAKLKAKQSDTCKNFLHKLSTKIVSENQTIVVEDLNVSGMIKNRRLSRAIRQAGWREFRTMCDAKSNKFSREFVVISRWKPTSQICSDCGYHWGKLDLSVREITCMNCGSHHCRDGNAFRNIELVGVGLIHDSKRTGRECNTPVGAVFVELSTVPKTVQLSLF